MQALAQTLRRVLTSRVARARGLVVAGLALVATGGLLPGCASEGYRYRYEPLPASFEAGEAKLLVAVLGARDGEGGALDMMHVRFRLQAPPDGSARLLPESLELLTGDLLAFGPAQVLEGSTLEAENGGEAVADVAFPFPDAEDYDLRGLSLSWTLLAGGESAAGTATFQRLSTSYHHYHDPWYHPYGAWGPGPHWGFGVGVSTH